MTSEHVRIARKAWRRYGKGTGHAARLNFGDCFSYALAHCLGEELLYKGKDFDQTDVARLVISVSRIRQLISIPSAAARTLG